MDRCCTPTRWCARGAGSAAGVILNQNVSIGADGFGYRPAADGKRLVKSPHLGIVILQGDVEIGATRAWTEASSGRWPWVRARRSTSEPDRPQLPDRPLLRRSGPDGAGRLGHTPRRDSVGGAVAIAEHVRIGTEVRIGGKSGVIRDVPDGKTYLGIPATDATQTLRPWAAIRKLPGWTKRMSRLAGIQQA